MSELDTEQAWREWFDSANLLDEAFIAPGYPTADSIIEFAKDFSRRNIAALTAERDALAERVEALETIKIAASLLADEPGSASYLLSLRSILQNEKRRAAAGV